jgi:hypothetical protein
MAFALHLIMRFVLGVQPSAPGGSSILIQPQLGPLQWARGSVASMKGAVAVEAAQSLDAAGLPSSMQLNVTVPGCVAARVCLAACLSNDAVRLDGMSTVGQRQGDYVCVAVPSGAHALACPSS